MHRLVLAFVLGALISAATLSYAGRPAGKCLDSIAPHDGFRYFSGNENRLHNHPAMYASGSGADATLTVLGFDVEQAFPTSEPDAAFAAYRALLVDRGYMSLSNP